MNEPERHCLSVFGEALECASPQERAAYLDRVCGQDNALRARVEELLQAHEAAGGFLQGNSSANVLESLAPDRVSTIHEPVRERPGVVLGPYKLLEQIGEGGFGIVFLAEQQQPLRRKVALKVLKPGMDTHQVVARFEAERQALALMDHPNIAHVFDGGETATGRPYFVMELVKGVPITNFCDQNQLNIRQRLELFASVCQAVQHAHQKGLIHRDLKPSNVLVTSHDGTPVVKVIDFGIAKATGQQLTDKTLFTHFAQMVGTPLYMSPEQAGQSGLDVDTRSDIYSLGVVLYELLTGTTPFDQERLRKLDYDELRRIIREEEPPKPSTRLSTLAQAATTASAQRQSDPKRLSRLFRGELDWIVMKALEKDRNRRYESASAFAADVQRYLRDEAVQACPPSAWYRFRKFARRHKARLTIAGGLVTAIAVLAGGAVWTLQDRAATQAKTTYKVNEHVQEAMLLWGQAKAAPVGDLSKWNAALEAANRAQAALNAGTAPEETHRRVRDLLAELEEEKAAAQRAAVQADKDRRMLALLPEVRLQRIAVRDGRMTGMDLAQTDRDYAAAFRDYGIDLDALPPAEAAERIRKGATPAELAAALDDWILSRWLIQRKATPALRRLVEVVRLADPDPLRNQLRDALLRDDPTAKQALERLAADPRALAWPAPTLDLLGTSLGWLVNAEAGVAFLRKARQRHPADFWINFQLAWFRGYSHPPDLVFGASTLVLMGSPLSQGPLVVCSSFFFPAQTNPPPWDEAIGCLMTTISLRGQSPALWFQYSYALEQKGAHNEAIAALREAIRLKPDFAAAYFNLGNALRDKGLYGEAIAAFREAIRIKPDFAMAYRGLANALRGRGAHDDAIAACHKAIQLERDNAIAYYVLGCSLDDEGRHDEAIEAYRQAIRCKPDHAQAHANLGRTLAAKGLLKEAIDECHEAIRHRPDLAEAHNNLGDALRTMGALDEAIDAFRKAIRSDPQYVIAYTNLGGVLAAKGLYDEAIAACREAIRLKPDDAIAYNNLANALRFKGAYDDAITASREAIRLKISNLASAYVNLGFSYRGKGQFAEALAALKKADQLGSANPGWPYPSKEWIRDCERLVALEKSLPAILQGKRKPADADERLELAKICMIRRLDAAAARLYEEAFAARPQLAEDLQKGQRYNAACAAALAGCGQGKDAAKLDDKERSRLRRQAVDWLRADLALWTRLIDCDDPQVRAGARQFLRHWQRDPDLVGLRDLSGLVQLPKAERETCLELWADVNTLLARMSPKTKRAPPGKP